MPTNWTPSVNSNVRSIARDLDEQLQNYSLLLKELRHFKGLQSLECKETPLPWSKSADRLCQKQRCTVDIQRYIEENKRNKTETLAKNIVTLNGDLLQHLSVDACPAPLSASGPALAPGHPNLWNVLVDLLRCILCWRKQVKAVAEQKTGSAL